MVLTLMAFSLKLQKIKWKLALVSNCMVFFCPVGRFHIKTKTGNVYWVHIYGLIDRLNLYILMEVFSFDLFQFCD